MAVYTHPTRKRKPRPGLEVAAISPKQPAARRRRCKRAHFGQTGLKTSPLRPDLTKDTWLGLKTAGTRRLSLEIAILHQLFWLPPMNKQYIQIVFNAIAR